MAGFHAYGTSEMDLATDYSSCMSSNPNWAFYEDALLLGSSPSSLSHVASAHYRVTPMSGTRYKFLSLPGPKPFVEPKAHAQRRHAGMHIFERPKSVAVQNSSRTTHLHCDCGGRSRSARPSSALRTHPDEHDFKAYHGEHPQRWNSSARVHPGAMGGDPQMSREVASPLAARTPQPPSSARTRNPRRL